MATMGDAATAAVTVASNPSFELPACGWRYVGEGRAHIVVKHPCLHGRVLRIRKAPIGPSAEADERFVRDYVERVLGSEVLGHCEHITVPSDTAAAIFREVDQFRDPHRRGSDRVVVTATSTSTSTQHDCSAFLLPDWRSPTVLSPAADIAAPARGCVTVEIKPKCGYPSVPIYRSGDRCGRHDTVDDEDDCNRVAGVKDCHSQSVGDTHHPSTSGRGGDGTRRHRRDDDDDDIGGDNICDGGAGASDKPHDSIDVIPRCRHCLHQTMKVAAGKWATTSAYCPVDLFSQTPQGVARAVEGLFTTPQNNLRVFVGDELVYGEETVAAPATAPDQTENIKAQRALLRDDAARIVAESLMLPDDPRVSPHERSTKSCQVQDRDKVPPDADGAGVAMDVDGNVCVITMPVPANPPDGLTVLAGVLAEALLRHPILSRILALQREATNDSMAAAAAAAEVLSVAETNSSESSFASEDDVVWCRGSFTDGISRASDELHSAREIVRRFIAGMVGKDLSIMLHVHPISTNPSTVASELVEEGAGTGASLRFAVRVGVIDFTLKRYVHHGSHHLYPFTHA